MACRDLLLSVGSPLCGYVGRPYAKGKRKSIEEQLVCRTFTLLLKSRTLPGDLNKTSGDQESSDLLIFCEAARPISVKSSSGAAAAGFPGPTHRSRGMKKRIIAAARASSPATT